MKNAFAKLSLLFKDRTLVSKVLFTLGLLVVFRALASIPIPGVDQAALSALLANSSVGQFFGLVSTFTGGGLDKLSIVMLGVGPFITASIVMQVLTIMSPKLKAMYQEEGEAGRRKFIQYSRLLTIPLALLQGISFLTLLERQGVITPLNLFATALNVIIVTAGSILLVWIGELISEFGIGNGSSLIIFAGIAAGVLSGAIQTELIFTTAQLPAYLALVIVGLIVIVGVVIVTEAERPIPVTYAKRVRGNKVYGGVSTYLPLRLNQAGVIPIIFALSFLLLPQIVLNLLTLTKQPWVQTASLKVTEFLQNNWTYAGAYFVLVFAFTYFYTAVTFDPHQIATNLQKSGAFIPGVRPGDSTETHLAHVITRLTLVGALFLGIIAILPIMVSAFTNITTLTVGGTSILIVVSVVLDLLKKVDAQLTVREY